MLVSSALADTVGSPCDVAVMVALAHQQLTRSLTDEESRRYLHVEACPAAP